MVGYLLMAFDSKKMDSMFGFQNSIHGMLSWFLDVRSNLIDGEGGHRAPAIAGHIANCHRVLSLPRGDLPLVQKTGIPFPSNCSGYTKLFCELKLTLSRPSQSITSTDGPIISLRINSISCVLSTVILFSLVQHPFMQNFHRSISTKYEEIFCRSSHACIKYLSF